MQLSQKHVDIVETLYGMNMELAKGSEEQRRELTKKIDEQICFDFGKRWGMKARAGGNVNNASKDSIGYLEDDGTVSVWDWQNGTTREPQIHAGKNPDYSHLPTSEAKFIEVDAVNHLSSVPDNGDDESDPFVEVLVEIKNDLKDVRADVTRLLNSQAALMESHIDIIQRLQILIDKPSPDLPFISFPEYEANTFFGKITLKPKK